MATSDVIPISMSTMTKLTERKGANITGFALDAEGKGLARIVLAVASTDCEIVIALIMIFSRRPLTGHLAQLLHDFYTEAGADLKHVVITDFASIGVTSTALLPWTDKELTLDIPNDHLGRLGERIWEERIPEILRQLFIPEAAAS